MLGDLEQKIIKEGEESQKLFEEFAEMCEDTSRELQHNIKTGEKNVASLKATIEEETAKIASFETKIDELASAIAKDDSDLKAAKGVRAKEAAAFQKESKELADVIDTLERAQGILEKELGKGSASLIQMKGAANLADALKVIIDASMINSADASRLTALVQTSDEDAAPGAPAAAAYENHSGGIIDAVENLREKAEAQLDKARKEEMTSKHNFEMLEQSLEDSMKFAEKDKAQASSDLGASNEAKATAEGDLAVTTKALKEDVKALAGLKHDCLEKSRNFEAEVKSRGEELKALGEAKKIIKEATGGAEAVSYSFLQTSSSVPVQVMKLIRELGKKNDDASLAQLSIRISGAVRSGSSEAGVFDKVKGLIRNMIDKLEKEAAEDATKEAYCDKEMAENTAKKEDKEALIKKLTTKIDTNSARSNKLKEEVSDLQKALAQLAKDQKEMNALRTKEKTLYDTTRAELEKGLGGVKQALKVLRDYYAKADKGHSSADGAGGGIIGLLEVVESDFSKGLAETISTEESAVAEYESQTKENEIQKTTKTQDVKYKTKESVSLDKSTVELKSDRTSTQEELDAINDYLDKLKGDCTVMPLTYEERKAKREAEISGLKEALDILSEGQSFVQKGRKSFRGSIIQ